MSQEKYLMMIGEFMKATDEILESILCMESTNYEKNFKKTLLYSYLDMMSKSVSKSTKHREKFIYLIDKFSDWEHKDFISLQMLLIELKEERNPKFIDLYNLINSKIEEFPNARPVELNYDYNITDLEKYWPENCKINGKYKLDYFTHKQLLYHNRNRLTHELRPSGTQGDLFDIKKPHYVQYSCAKRNATTNKLELVDDSWQLNYPLDFYIELCISVKEQIKSYLIEYKIDPYENYYFGDSWLG